MVVNLTFSIFERFCCAILLIYKNRMAVNGVNVFINFFLLYILMLSKVVYVLVFYFLYPDTTKEKLVFLFLVPQVLVACFSEIQGGKLI